VSEPHPDDGGRKIFDEDDSDRAETEEFDRALAAGTDALGQGDPGQARIALEKALRYKPRNQRARNLLGLSLFKLGELQRAEEIYRSLIDDHPGDPTLRVNLGLVFLKENASADAVRCFETALDLQPDHQKAQNYLGLALAQKGELGKAREWFLRAGNEAMAAKMADSLQKSPIRDVADGASEALGHEQPFRPAVEEMKTAEPAPSGWVATGPSAAAAPPVTPRADPVRLAANVPEPSQPEATSPAEAISEATADAAGPVSMSQYTDSRRLTMPEGAGGFSIGPSEILVQVRGEMLTRLDGLVASWGSLSIKPVMKRFRGKPTDKAFGDGPRRMLRASGEGRFVISREGRQFTALELGDEPAYFREEVLFAFEDSLVFENGRVPGRSGSDLQLVHLRGTGRLLLTSSAAPQSVDVRRGEPLRIPMDQLIGWHGPLIQPRLVPIVEEAPELGVALELAGEGRALIDVPAR
jgi:uncharacterized protein (AIM24 family)